jgi:2-polyprenyl-6-methoxyphenol hydroxylase-like FAD-dependent oxidoreductase
MLRHPIWDLAPHLPRYVTDAMARVGDAAHAMTPSLGRGACEAILDGEALTTCPAEHDDITNALTRCDALRRPRTQRMVSRSRIATTLTTAHRGLVRNTVVRALAPLMS